MLDQNLIRNFYIPIGYPIGPTSNIYEENQATIKIFLEDRITTRGSIIDVFITVIHEHQICKKMDMAETRSNMQLYDLNSKPHGFQILIDIIDCAIGAYFYPPPGYNYQKCLCLERFHEPTHCKAN